MYQQFSVEKIAEFADEQAVIIRRHSDAPITHNSSMAFSVDNERLFRNLDFASFDSYATTDHVPAFLINNDLFRSFKRGRDYWIMETSPSFAASLGSYAKPHPDGYLRAEAVAAYALGAEAFCYWLWRQQRAGCEQPHGSVLSAWGKPAVGYHNVLEVEKARLELEEIILNSRPAQAETALTYSDRAKAFLKTEPHRKLNHRGLMTDFYARILNIGIHRDVLPEGSELEGYKLLFTPFLPYVATEFADRAIRFVENGGIWVVGPLTGGRTKEHTIHTDSALGRLETLAGVEAVHTYPMDGSGAIGHAFGHSAPLSLWSSVFKLEGAAAVGTIEGGLTPELAWITEKKHGEGKIVMVVSMPAGEEGQQLLEALIQHYADEAGVTQCSDVTPGTIVAPRRGDGEVWVIVNMDGRGGHVTIPRAAVDGFTKEPLIAGTRLQLQRYEYRVIRF